MAIKITRAHLDAAAAQQIVSPEQAQALWVFLQAPRGGIESARFQMSHILYYLGGMLAIAAMSLFMTKGWDEFGPWALFLTSIVYGLLLWWLGDWLLRYKQQTIPAGILLTLVIVLVPLAVFAACRSLGWWPDAASYGDYHFYINWNWLLLELATLAAGAILFWRYRLPFMLMPISVTLWYTSMDMADWLLIWRYAADSDWYGGGWQFRQCFSIGFGLVQLLFALLVDYRSRRGPDYAFWLYLFGLLAFWGGMTSMDSGNELSKVFYCLINLGLIFLGAVLSRRVFAVFGGMGIYAYLGHLAWRVFENSLWFPLALSLLGLLIIAAGFWWNKQGEKLAAQLRCILPASVREWLELERT